MFAEDTSVFLADFGVPVIWGAVTGTGILDAPDLIVGDGMSVSTDYSLLARYADFGGVHHGDSVTVDGENYEARGDARKETDGAFCRILLSKVE